MDEQPLCCVCDRPASVRDTEYDEAYCDCHAEMYEVFDGPCERLGV